MCLENSDSSHCPRKICSSVLRDRLHPLKNGCLGEHVRTPNAKVALAVQRNASKHDNKRQEPRER